MARLAAIVCAINNCCITPIRCIKLLLAYVTLGHLGQTRMFSPLDGFDQIELDVDEMMRPRTLRKIGITPEWDLAIDNLGSPRLNSISALAAWLCRFYRRVRPRAIGDRCAFEPSCSRYSEISFRLFGMRIGLSETISRLRRCNAHNGGLDLPMGINDLVSFSERNDL